MTEYAAPPGYEVVAPDWDRELRRPILLRCAQCAALVLGGGDTGRHDAWHRSLRAAYPESAYAESQSLESPRG